MTDVAVRDENQAGEAQQPPAGAETSALVLWAYAAREANRIAHSLAATSFVPASLRGKPQDITAAILAGQELGLQPMATLRSMDVIQGTPALRAHAMRGLVQSRGHAIQLVESTDKLCTMRARRKGEDEWQEVTWTIEQAQQLGLLGKDQWKKQPKNMLVARCTGAICRLVAADVLYAMPYAAEELEGDSDRGAPIRATTTRAGAAEIMANAAAARQEAKPVSAPPADTGQAPAVETGEDPWDGIEVATPADGEQP